MPRKNPIAAVDRQICGRLRLFRLTQLEMSQAKVARKLSIDSVRLASYEHARVPLRFAFADHFARTFNVNQWWFAEGRSRPTPYIKLSSGVTSRLDKDELFSTVWKDSIRPALAELERDSLFEAILISQEPDKNVQLMPTEVQSRQLIERLEDRIKRHFGALSDVSRWEFLKFLNGAVTEFVLNEEGEPDTDWEDPQENKPLTDITASANNASVKSPMANLLDRLNKATDQRGMKSKLAKIMGVPLANVSQWLSGERMPGGETTLRLLHWVEQYERNSK